jgi:UDP-3-O-acyl-N-acetylglucosamine deacetylase
LRGHYDNSNLVEANIEKAREAEKTAQRNLNNHLEIKLEDNTSSLNQEKLRLDDEHVTLHKKIVALLGEHEATLVKSQSTETEIRRSERKFETDLERIRTLNAHHDQVDLEIQRLFAELQLLFQ